LRGREIEREREIVGNPDKRQRLVRYVHSYLDRWIEIERGRERQRKRNGKKIEGERNRRYCSRCIKNAQRLKWVLQSDAGKLSYNFIKRAQWCETHRAN
jgi:hypothetical protein